MRFEERTQGVYVQLAEVFLAGCFPRAHSEVEKKKKGEVSLKASTTHTLRASAPSLVESIALAVISRRSCRLEVMKSSRKATKKQFTRGKRSRDGF